jgi:hypothetical protein
MGPCAGVADGVWISLVVPVALLLATLLLQRLEAKLLDTPERVEHPDHPVPHPSDSLPLLTIGPLESPPTRPRRAAGHPRVRATV